MLFSALSLPISWQWEKQQDLDQTNTLSQLRRENAKLVQGYCTSVIHWTTQMVIRCVPAASIAVQSGHALWRLGVGATAYSLFFLYFQRCVGLRNRSPTDCPDLPPVQVPGAHFKVRDSSLPKLQYASCCLNCSYKLMHAVFLHWLFNVRRGTDKTEQEGALVGCRSRRSSALWGTRGEFPVTLQNF